MSGNVDRTRFQVQCGLGPAADGAETNGSQSKFLHSNDFKHPPPPLTETVGSMNGNIPRTRTLVTPDKRLITSSEQNEVRKRPFPTSPTPYYGSDATVTVGKKKHVAKCLFGAPVMPLVNKTILGSNIGTSRCLFGAPSQEENLKIFNELEEKTKQEFEVFSKRYQIESVLDVHY